MKIYVLQTNYKGLATIGAAYIDNSWRFVIDKYGNKKWYIVAVPYKTFDELLTTWNTINKKP